MSAAALQNKLSKIENGNNTNNSDVNHPVMLDGALHRKHNLYSPRPALLKWAIYECNTSLFKV